MEQWGVVITAVSALIITGILPLVTESIRIHTSRKNARITRRRTAVVRLLSLMVEAGDNRNSNTEVDRAVVELLATTGRKDIRLRSFLENQIGNPLGMAAAMAGPMTLWANTGRYRGE